jgi:hypothetical protein
MNTTTLMPVKQEVLSPQQYLESVKADRQNIERAIFIPPVIGDGTFGKFVVTYRFMTLRPVRG